LTTRLNKAEAAADLAQDIEGCANEHMIAIANELNARQVLLAARRHASASAKAAWERAQGELSDVATQVVTTDELLAAARARLQAAREAAMAASEAVAKARASLNARYEGELSRHESRWNQALETQTLAARCEEAKTRHDEAVTALKRAEEEERRGFEVVNRVRAVASARQRATEELAQRQREAVDAEGALEQAYARVELARSMSAAQAALAEAMERRSAQDERVAEAKAALQTEEAALDATRSLLEAERAQLRVAQEAANLARHAAHQARQARLAQAQAAAALAQDVDTCIRVHEVAVANERAGREALLGARRFIAATAKAAWHSADSDLKDLSAQADVADDALVAARRRLQSARDAVMSAEQAGLDTHRLAEARHEAALVAYDARRSQALETKRLAAQCAEVAASRDAATKGLADAERQERRVTEAAERARAAADVNRKAVEARAQFERGVVDAETALARSASIAQERRRDAEEASRALQTAREVLSMCERNAAALAVEREGAGQGLAAESLAVSFAPRPHSGNLLPIVALAALVLFSTLAFVHEGGLRVVETVLAMAAAGTMAWSHHRRRRLAAAAQPMSFGGNATAEPSTGAHAEKRAAETRFADMHAQVAGAHQSLSTEVEKNALAEAAHAIALREVAERTSALEEARTVADQIRARLEVEAPPHDVDATEREAAAIRQDVGSARETLAAFNALWNQSRSAYEISLRALGAAVEEVLAIPAPTPPSAPSSSPQPLEEAAEVVAATAEVSALEARVTGMRNRRIAQAMLVAGRKQEADTAEARLVETVHDLGVALDSLPEGQPVALSVDAEMELRRLQVELTKATAKLDQAQQVLGNAEEALGGDWRSVLAAARELVSSDEPITLLESDGVIQAEQDLARVRERVTIRIQEQDAAQETLARLREHEAARRSEHDQGVGRYPSEADGVRVHPDEEALSSLVAVLISRLTAARAIADEARAAVEADAEPHDVEAAERAIAPIRHAVGAARETLAAKSALLDQAMRVYDESLQALGASVEEVLALPAPTPPVVDAPEPQPAEVPEIVAAIAEVTALEQQTSTLRDLRIERERVAASLAKEAETVALALAATARDFGVEFDALPEGAPVLSIADADSELQRLRVELTQAMTKLDQARGALARVEGALGGDWRGVVAATRENLTGLEVPIVIPESDAVGQAKRNLERLKESVQARTGEIEAAQTVLSVLRDQEALRRSEHDHALGRCDVEADGVGEVRYDELLSSLSSDIERGERELETLPRSEGTSDELAALEGQLERRLKSHDNAVEQLRGQLLMSGGIVVQEQLSDLERELERRREELEAKELRWEGQRLLYETIQASEKEMAMHLGACLSAPVSRQFQELTNMRYESVIFDDKLRADGVTVAGGLRSTGQLSVGTRDQLGTIVRLTLAGEMRSAVLVDDHLVHSDTDRMAWFRDRLQTAAHRHQVIVITTRPLDYFPTEVRPLPGERFRDSADGMLRAIDLTQIIQRGI
jgi:hypothetical protein